MPKRQLRIAVVELNRIHDELFPTWLYLADQCGYAVDFFISPAHESRDIFAVLKLPRPKCFLTSSPNLGNTIPKRIVRIIHSSYLRVKSLVLLRINYDLVIANSIEPAENYQLFFRFINKPMLAVLHNGNVLVEKHLYGNLVEGQSSSIMVLSRHVQRYLAENEISSFAVYPFPELAVQKNTQAQAREHKFCVQGSMNFNRRNYDSLLNAAAKLKEANVRCTFSLVGRLNRSARIMQERIGEMGVSDYFVFESSVERYRDYYGAIRDCMYLLILVDDSSMIYQKFFEDKCTSSLNVALGLEVIPVVNRNLAKVYGIEECSVLYESDDVYSGIKSALSNDSERMETLASNQSLSQMHRFSQSTHFRKALPNFNFLHN